LRTIWSGELGWSSIHRRYLLPRDLHGFKQKRESIIKEFSPDHNSI